MLVLGIDMVALIAIGTVTSLMVYVLLKNFNAKLDDYAIEMCFASSIATAAVLVLGYGIVSHVLDVLVRM